MAVLEYLQQKRMIENIKSGVLRKFPLLGATMANLTFESNDEIKTAGTNGKEVIYSPKFVEELTFDERVCLFSHEIMHVAFDHIMRSKGRDKKLWNKATDSVINQMLKSANLPLPAGGVDIAEAVDKSAEEMYEILKEQKKQQEEERMQNQSNNQNNDNQNAENNQEAQGGQGRHDMWEEAIKRAEKEEQEKQQEGKSISKIDETKEQDNQTESNSSMMAEMEKSFTKENESLKQKMGQQIRENLRKQKQEMSDAGSGGYTSQFEGVGEARSILSWKKILRRELEKEEDRWSYRRADDDNDFQARIGTLEVEDYPETEVMLDVSGSVDDDFLKGFLRQLKPLLKESKLKVGCFDEYVYDFVDIKSSQDIDHFSVTRTSPWTENWDAAVRAFSKNKGVNKIVFTDGNPCPGVMPKDDLNKVNVIWLVFENKNFKPCCGKVIFTDRRELGYLSKIDELETSI